MNDTAVLLPPISCAPKAHVGEMVLSPFVAYADRDKRTLISQRRRCLVNIPTLALALRAMRAKAVQLIISTAELIAEGGI